MDIEQYNKTKDIFLGTMHLLFEMPLEVQTEFTSYQVPDTDYMIELSNYNESESRSTILRLRQDGYRLYELSFKSNVKYFSTFHSDSMRIATWQTIENPRFYALYDPDNGRNGDNYTFIQYPCLEDYFFQRSTVQNTLEYEDYALWDDVSLYLQENLYPNDNVLSVGLDIHKRLTLSTEELLSMLEPFLANLGNIKSKKEVL